MIRDSELIMSGTLSSGTEVGQRISSSGATASTDYIDTLAAGDAFKSGARLKLLCTSPFVGTGTTITITLETGATSSCGTTIFSTGAIAKASAVAGAVLADVVIPIGVLRYLRCVYTTDNTFETTGRISAFVVLDTEKTLDRSL